MLKGTNCPLGRFLKGKFQLQCGIGAMARPGSNPGNSLLSKHQSGNHKYNSKETLNIVINDFLLDALDNKRLSALILLDLSKAFDSISHSILLQKLSLVAADKTTKRFESYLTDRTQVVRIGTSTSTPLPTPIAYHRAPYCHHFCLVFISVIFLSLHKYAISSST